MIEQPTEILMVSMYGTATQLAQCYDAMRAVLPCVNILYATARVSTMVEYVFEGADVEEDISDELDQHMRECIACQAGGGCCALRELEDNLNE